ncbi:MAG: ribosome maturation factor RimM [Candidatus Deferrimicrobiaceae bacterium]
MREAYVKVGRVTGAHGRAGKIRVKAYSGDPSGLLHARTLRLSAENPGKAGRIRDFEVRTAQPQGGFVVLSLGGIDSQEAATEWSGATVSVFRAELPPPEEDEYYWMDLIGCEAVDAAGDRVGEIVAVEGGAAHDWLVIRRDDGEFLLPIVSSFLREVDVPGRRLVVAPPKGW